MITYDILIIDYIHNSKCNIGYTSIWQVCWVVSFIRLLTAIFVLSKSFSDEICNFITYLPYAFFFQYFMQENFKIKVLYWPFPRSLLSSWDFNQVVKLRTLPWRSSARKLFSLHIFCIIYFFLFLVPKLIMNRFDLWDL